MPEYEAAKFVVHPENLTFLTKVNGDRLVFADISLDADTAATLARLINTPGDLKIELKKVQ